jgi:hypothetical protein
MLKVRHDNPPLRDKATYLPATPAEADWLVRSGDAAIPARSKKESDPLRDMGTDLGVQRL